MSNRTNKEPNGQPDLFNSEDNASGQKVAASESALYLLTNNLNLVDILSSGMIKPAAFFEKYYPDLGSTCPQAVPLLKVPPSDALIGASIETDEITFPIVLEIAADGLSGPAWVISSKFTSRKGKVSQRENVAAILINGVLPASIISSIHFRSETDLQEFTVRRYANLDPEQGNHGFVISPQMFAGNLAAEDLLSAISGTCRKIPSLAADVVNRIDSVEGMLSLLGKYASLDHEFPLQIYADILNLYFGSGASESPSERSNSIPYQWLTEFINDQQTVDTANSALNRITANVTNTDQSGNREALLGRLAVRQSIRMKPEEFSPDGYLDALSLDLEQQSGRLESETTLDEYRSAFEMLKEVRTGFTGLDSFFERFPSENYPILAGLFLHLSDNRPENVIQLASQYRNVPVEARVFAACLAGALHGRTRLEMDCRSGKNLTYVLEMASIARINTATDSVRLVAPGQDAVVMVDRTEQGRDEILLIGDEILIKRLPDQKRVGNSSIIEKRQNSLPPRGIKLNERYQKQERVETAMEKIIEKLRNSDAFAPGTQVGQLAIAICRFNKWFDLISTVIPLREQEYYLENHRGKHEFRLSGYIVPEHRINRPDEFRSRLLALTPNQLEQMKDSKLIAPLVAKLSDEWFSQV